VADPVRISNFFASFDTEAVISQLTAARQTVITKMDMQSTVATAKKAALAQIQSLVASFLGRANALSALNSVGGKTATVTGSGVTAAATPASTTGSFTVDVTKLATGSKLLGTTISAAIDAASPMSKSNFGVLPTNGTFTIATATGGSHTFGIGGADSQSAALLNAANFSTPVTAGTFTITTASGGAAHLTIDPTTQSLDDVVVAINGSGIGVTAAITNDAYGRSNQITLASTLGAITLSDPTDSSNFLSATNLLTSNGTTTRVSSTAFTQQISLNKALADITASGIGVTATVTNDAGGKPNIVSLASTQGAITLGNGGDTSNFLNATSLSTSPPGATRASSQSLARINAGFTLANAGFFGGAPAVGAHTIAINGANVSYDASSDTLGDLINRINSSAAGVTARYDSQTDLVQIQNNKSGALSITVAEDGAGGDLAAKLGLLTATATLGDNAEYKIDGGPAQTSPTNTVTTGSGVTLTFTALTTPLTPATVSVGQDTTSAVNAVKGFVADFNSVLAAIDAATKADGAKENNRSGVLSGDASLRQLKATMRGLVTGSGLNLAGNFKTLSQVGFSFGAVGSAVGTTNTLQLDETRFKTALANDPSSVQAVLSAFTLTPTLQPGGTGSITGLSGTFAGGAAGKYDISDDGAGNLTAVFSPATGATSTVTNAAVLAGGSTTSLIPGVTVNVGAFQMGSHTVSVAASSESVIRLLKDFADMQAGPGGVLQKRQDTYAAVSRDLAARKVALQGHIDAEMETLRKKFAAMEQAQARAQAVQSQLTQLANQLAANGKN
jgi:flagellar hook-associated protein 2